MEFTRGDWVSRDHAENGKDLHLFESLDEGYRYLVCLPVLPGNIIRGPTQKEMRGR